MTCRGVCKARDKVPLKGSKGPAGNLRGVESRPEGGRRARKPFADRIYGIRFKIEVSFKQAVHTIGTYAYHFWMAAMRPHSRRSGNQYMHRESRHYRDAVRRKLHAYHCHLQIGVIAQGLMQCLAVTQPRTIWRLFGSWLRTVRPNLPPSERVVAVSLRNALVDFLAVAPQNHYLAKFIRPRIDPDRAEGLRLAS